MNKSLIFSILVGGGVAVGIGLLFFLLHQSNDQQKHIVDAQQQAPALVAANSQPTITIKDIVLKERGKDKHYELTVTAKESTIHHATDKIECKNITCTITRQGKQIAHLTAEKSIIDRPGKRVIFAGPVNGSFKDITMQGSDINYNFSQQTVTTDQPATYTHESFKLSAQQSFVDIKTQKIILKNGVSSEFLYRPATDNSSN